MTGEQRPQRQSGKRWGKGRGIPAGERDRTHAKATATGVPTFGSCHRWYCRGGRPGLQPPNPAGNARGSSKPEKTPETRAVSDSLFRARADRIKSDGSINDSPCSCSFVCGSRSSSSVGLSSPSFASFLLSLSARLGGGPAPDTGATRRAKVSRRAPAR